MPIAQYHNKSLTFLLFCFVISSCSNRIDRNDYFTRVKSYDSGLHKKSEIGNYFFDVLYTPPEYQVLMREDKDLTREQITLIARENTDLQYFQLELGLTDESLDLLESMAPGIEEKERLLYYFSYGLQNDIYLETAREQYPCLMFHFERSFDLRNSRRFLLAFENADPASQVQLVIDSKLFSEQPIKVAIDKSNIPEL